MIVVVATSALVLILVKTRTIVIRGDVSTEPILNTEFLPMGRAGYLALNEFDFCNFVDENFNCLNQQDEFYPSDDIYLRFVAESTVFNGEVIIVHNYRVKNPSGEVVLEAEQKSDFAFEMKSGRETELVVFSEYFNLGKEAQPGEYTVEMIVRNPLLDKEVTLVKEFKVV